MDKIVRSHDLIHSWASPQLWGSGGQGLLQISPAVFQVSFMIDVAGKQEYLLYSPHGFMKSVFGFELIVV